MIASLYHTRDSKPNTNPRYSAHHPKTNASTPSDPATALNFFNVCDILLINHIYSSSKSRCGTQSMVSSCGEVSLRNVRDRLEQYFFIFKRVREVKTSSFRLPSERKKQTFISLLMLAFNFSSQRAQLIQRLRYFFRLKCL